ncbi:HK97 family phage prohead protease [Loigolactobacillus bifermentans]|uniref:HK97 family phage prohead protease n=1 Tax=Loigolactobacillus bifermentans TaxID=1607 RepID=UPI00070DA8C2|nr:HK97 family phage prohead protease [Loigolactobacillus bifermentans]QGG59127.1 HK97 family phage prohead protease [Loigolactobacillus bifermentans]
MTIKAREVRTYQISHFNKRDATDANPATIKGYASVFNSPTIIADCWQEQIEPGAFSKSLGSDDIRCLFNHNWDHVLGRSQSGTLTLQEDEHGLAFEVALPETTTAQDLAVSMNRGDINQCSFGFCPTIDEWDYSDPDMPVRTIKEVKLYEISIVPLPAYGDTEANLVRSGVISEDMVKNIQLRKEIMKEIERGLTL